MKMIVKDIKYSKYHLVRMFKIAIISIIVLFLLSIIGCLYIDASNKIFANILTVMILLGATLLSCGIIIAVLIDDLLTIKYMKPIDIRRYNSWKRIKHKIFVSLFAILVAIDIYITANQNSVAGFVLTDLIILAVGSVFIVTRSNENIIDGLMKAEGKTH